MIQSRKPAWLTSQKTGGRKAREIISYLRRYNLHTVCESARCPNRGECFERGTATFMILGETCTRNCTFCAVNKDKSLLQPPDPAEPDSLAELAALLELQHVVITTVTRDDLPDGGAGQFIKVIEALRRSCRPDVSIEVLISDLQGDAEQIARIVRATPDVLNHNVETVSRLYPLVRPQADFRRSLRLLQQARELAPDMITKSGFMVGLGESREEVISLLEDLRAADVNLVTIGQYLAPSDQHFPVAEYVHPDIFSQYREAGIKLGFQLVEAAPLVRSSYHAEKARKFMKKG
ncbi:MAG: lipoyl synthase [Candidatus Cloacimonetes bacterium]|nr:lipoyl synthase [Candidatus Cloacimonadota bacterium]